MGDRGCDGLGYLLSQQLVAAGERVVDVPATLAARTRVLGSSKSNKTDPNDVRSVALTALRHQSLHAVRPVGHSEVLRLLAKRNTDIGDRRTKVVCRLHALLVELAPGGSSKEIKPTDVDTFLARLCPTTPVERTRYALATELLAEVRLLDNSRHHTNGSAPPSSPPRRRSPPTTVPTACNPTTSASSLAASPTHDD